LARDSTGWSQAAWLGECGCSYAKCYGDDLDGSPRELGGDRNLPGQRTAAHADRANPSGEMAVTTPEHAGAAVPGSEQVVMRPVRILLGWLADQEAAQLLMGRAPMPTDDLRPQLTAVASSRNIVAKRHEFVSEDPVCDVKHAKLQKVAERPEVQAHFHGFTWRPTVVDLRKVLSFQKLVNVDGLDSRVGQATPANLDELIEVCLPSQQAVAPTGALTDADGKGFTISSLNPNLRIAGAQLSDAMVSPAPGLPTVKMQAVTLFVSMGTSYVQVIRYRDRCFVRDGYHRAAALIRRGIYEVPCIFIEAQRFEDLSCPPGSFPYEVLYSSRPPFLTDFWAKGVAADATQLSIRKVVRIRGEEFGVPR